MTPIAAAQILPIERADRQTWRAALWLIAGVTVLRVVYSIWLSPWDLLGDEAYYWAQSQHLDWSYAEKGPLLAWMIALCCKLFGNTEWAVRLPVILSSTLAALMLGRLALSITRGNQTVAFWSVVIFFLIPAFVGNAQICTQDGPLFVLILAITGVGLRLMRRWEAGQSTWPDWLLLYATFGAGVLLKQSVLLMGTALVCYAVVRFRKLKIRPVLVAQQVVGLVVFMLMISPIVVWESRAGWPMVHHTMGHLGLGGDQVGSTPKGNAAVWVGNTVGALVGAVGPAALGLMLWATVSAYRSRKENDPAWRDRFWLICCSWPSVLFFVFVSFYKPAVPSWPLPHVVPLVVLMAELVSTELPRLQEKMIAWRTARRAGDVSVKKPGGAFAVLWGTFVWYGAIGTLIVLFPTALGHIPVYGKKIDEKVLSRLTGNRAEAREVENQIFAERARLGDRPVVVTRHYQQASLLSFYLPPGRVVTSAGSYVSSRLSNFDEWDDTRLDAPAMLGKKMLLVGGDLDRWSGGLKFERVDPINNGNFVGVNYAGPRVERADRRRVAGK